MSTEDLTDEFKTQVKIFLIDTLALEDITPTDIHEQTALFGDGLRLDSIDALELGVGLHKKYGIKISEQDTEVYKQHFATFGTFVRFIKEHKTK